MTFKNISGFDGLLNSFKKFWKFGGIYYEKNNGIDLAHFLIKTLFHLLNAIWLILTIQNNKNCLGNLGEAIYGLLISLGLNFAVLSFWCKKEHFKYILENFNQTYDYESDLVEECSKKIMKKKSESLKKLYKFSLGFAVFVFVNNTLVAYAAKYLLGEKDILLVNVSTPINYKNKIWYFFVLIWQIFYHVELASTIISVGSFILFILVTLLAEFDILEFALSNTKKRIEEIIRNFHNNSEILNDIVSTRCTKDFIKHHIYIIRYFENAKICLIFFFLLIFLNGVALTAALGLIMLLAELDVKIKILVLTISQVVYIGLLCLQGQILADQSQAIRVAIYEVEFWTFPKSCSSYFIMMLIRTRKPLSYTTPIGNVIGLRMFTTIMRGSYTYFNSLTQLF